MNRKLLFFERFIYGDGTTSKNIAFTVKIHGTFTPHHLRQALNKVQARHPLLTAAIVEDEQGAPWFATPACVPEIPLRIADRHTDEGWMQVAEAECGLPFNLQQGPLMRVVWLQGQGVSELMLVCHHCICDGASLVTLLREILLLLDQPHMEIGRYESFSTLHDLVPGYREANKRLRRRGRLMTLLLRLILFFAATRREIPWGRPYILRWELSQAETAALIARCRNEQVTLHAALCLAFLDVFPPQQRGRQRRRKIFCPVNIRRYIPAIKPGMLLGFAAGVALTLDDRPGQHFFSRARKMNAQLRAQLEGMRLRDKLVLCEYQYALAKELEKHFNTAKGNQLLTFSNMGRLDIPKYYHSFEIAAIHNPVLLFRSANPNGIIASTFDNRLSFSLLSNDRYLSLQEAEATRDKAMALLDVRICKCADAQVCGCADEMQRISAAT